VPVAVVDHDGHEGNPDLTGVLDSVFVVVNEGCGVEVRLPLLDAYMSQMGGGKGARGAGLHRGGRRGMQPTVAGVERTSMIWSFHWSPIVNLQFPPGLGNVKRNDVPALQQKLRRLFIGKKDRLFR